MQLEEIDLPEGWEEHENYARRMPGVIAAYKTEDAESGMRFIEVIEYAPSHDYNFKVELLRQVGAEPETTSVDSTDVNGYGEAGEVVVELAEQCK